jgi:hypothetical protein
MVFASGRTLRMARYDGEDPKQEKYSRWMARQTAPDDAASVNCTEGASFRVLFA